ncbi:MAG: nitronate monooxygenase [Bdellovibrionota bacterium]
MNEASRRFVESVGVQYPVICGAMYPCSNPELVAAVSEAGGLGIIQPLSLSYVYGYEFKKGLQYIRSLTSKPVGMNVLIEASSKIYLDRMRRWVDEALDQDVRFFVTALGNPDWVVEKVHARGGLVYHDVTERKWAEKALAGGVDGLICVNGRAGGHAGTRSPEDLFESLKDLGVPLVCAGGVGDPATFRKMIDLGYGAVQLGTRFIASEECKASADYKRAIIEAEATDVVLTERLTGVPVAVINTPYVQRIGLHAGPIAKFMLQHRKLKHWMRLFYQVKSVYGFKKSIVKPQGYEDYWQAGKSVGGITSVEKAADIVRSFSAALL